MLWSAKEAAVKMVGCGFHLIDPRDMTVTILDKGESACYSHVTFTIDAKVNEVRVYSMEQSWGWISFALSNKKLSIQKRCSYSGYFVVPFPNHCFCFTPASRSQQLQTP